MTDMTQPKKKYGRPDDERIIDFMKIAKPAAIISILLTLASIFFIATKGLNLGLDFTGGVSAELNYKQPANQVEVIQALNQAGFKDAVVQTLGSNKDLLVRMPVQNIEVEDLNNAITKAAQLPNNPAEVHKVDSVGGQVGNELYIRSAGAVALALLLMLVYVTIRFEFKLAVGAVLSLFHDIIVTIGIFAMMQWPFDLTVLAAILALLGFSLNDNIVVSDVHFIKSSDDFRHDNIAQHAEAALDIIKNNIPLVLIDHQDDQGLLIFQIHDEMVTQFKRGLAAVCGLHISGQPHERLSSIRVIIIECQHLAIIYINNAGRPQRVTHIFVHQVETGIKLGTLNIVSHNFRIFQRFDIFHFQVRVLTILLHFITASGTFHHKQHEIFVDFSIDTAGIENLLYVQPDIFPCNHFHRSVFSG